MAMEYDKQVTALLVIDPYNDFISEGGKLWNRVRTVAEANDCVPHMLQILNAARQAKLRVFYAVHHRYRPGDYETWKYVAPIQRAGWRNKSFEDGTWGRRVPRRIRARAGRRRSAGTLVLQRFRQHRPGFAPQEARRPSAHRHRADSAYLHRSDRSLRRRARLRGHCGEGRDSGLFGRDDARRARHQHAELRRRYCHDKRGHCRDFFSLSPRSEEHTSELQSLR